MIFLRKFSLDVLQISRKVSMLTQSAITCLKLTIETLEKGVQYVQS